MRMNDGNRAGRDRASECCFLALIGDRPGNAFEVAVPAIDNERRALESIERAVTIRPEQIAAEVDACIGSEDRIAERGDGGCNDQYDECEVHGRRVEIARKALLSATTRLNDRSSRCCERTRALSYAANEP